MNILLIEDDAAKRKALKTFLGARRSGIAIAEAMSFSGALDVLAVAVPDIILLDMTIPSIERSTSDRDHTLVYGGRDVLRQLRRIRCNAYVLVVTQYEQFDEGPESMSLSDLDEQLRAMHPERYVGAVSFSFVYDTWKRELDLMLTRAEHAIESNNAPINEQSEP